MRPTGSHNLKREHSASEFLSWAAEHLGTEKRESGAGAAANTIWCSNHCGLQETAAGIVTGTGTGTAAAALMSSKCSATNAPQNSSHGPLSASPFASIGQCVLALVNILIIYMEYATPRGWARGRAEAAVAGRSGRGDKTFDNRRDRFAAAASSTAA